MNRKYIIGNWKSNKNSQEMQEWFQTFQKLSAQGKIVDPGKIEVVTCLPYILLPQAKWFRDQNKLTLKLGGQDVSPYPNGAYTGEISAVQLSEFVEYAIIGHSERRKYFKEDDSMLSQKVLKAKEANLKVIFCVPDENTFIPAGIDIVAYEPVWAIGSGKTDTPDNANRVAESIKKKWGGGVLIYGGSVTPENVASFVTTEFIDGVLPGGASLDPNKFWQMIVNAATI